MRRESSWLAVAEESIRQDLDTSKKELRLIRDLLGESDINSTTSKTPDSRQQTQRSDVLYESLSGIFWLEGPYARRTDTTNPTVV